VDPGRPRATDEAQLDYALMMIGQYEALSTVHAHHVGEALAAKGGRFVRGKAAIIRQMMARHGAELRSRHGRDIQFGLGVHRASELGGE
jgi:hypothetical protein